MRHRTARNTQFVTAILAVSLLSACSGNDGNAPSGVTFSAELDSIPSVSSPIPETELRPTGSRPVAYVENTDTVTVLSLGSNTCGVTVKGQESGTESMSVDLKSEPTSQIKHSDQLGQYAEAGIEPLDQEWVLRCGSHGMQICGMPVTESTKVVGLVEADDSDCLAAGPAQS